MESTKKDHNGLPVLVLYSGKTVFVTYCGQGQPATVEKEEGKEKMVIKPGRKICLVLSPCTLEITARNIP
ncbi:hypothetical protein N7537_007063 [Penicillium hordei]|uniref:Uncharacterized protein n=1 Tax=Penicillium hordei TaxID=40994 RepID=A0AAD6H4T0_9EURO|nr:uncharacterized protein N7537_007063 [Penicillium hordei]KAJ5604107.1 hypothetical protein N7537_007063 [Penicillium hordei]